MAKKRVGKFPKAFRQYAVARLKQCDNNGTRLHSSLGYRPPNEFERGLASGPPSDAARMQFFTPAQELKPGEEP